MYTPKIKAPKRLDVDMGDGTLTVHYHKDQVTMARLESVTTNNDAFTLALASILHSWDLALLHERVTVIEHGHYARHMHPHNNGSPAPAQAVANSAAWSQQPAPADDNLVLLDEDEPISDGTMTLILGGTITQLPTNASAEQVQDALYGGEAYVVAEQVPGGWVITYAVVPGNEEQPLTVDGDVVITDRYRENEPRQVLPSFDLLRQMDIDFLQRVFQAIMNDQGSDQGKSANSSGGLRPTGRGRVK
jgi:hypothetical protein